MLSVEAIASGIVALAIAGGGLLALRHKASKVTLEVARDKADRTEVESLIAEVQRLRLQAVADAEEKAKLHAENEHLGVDLLRLEHEIHKRTRGLPEEVRRVIDTAFIEFDEGRLP